VTAAFAGVGARVPETSAHAVVFALCELRPTPGKGRRAATASAAALSAAGAVGLEGVERLEAAAALAPAIRVAFPDVAVAAIDDAPPESWARCLESSAVAAYWHALRILPPRRRPRVLIRLIWPTAADAVASDRLSGGREHGPFVARLRRWARALSGVEKRR
jgi:hypothetical protein